MKGFAPALTLKMRLWDAGFLLKITAGAVLQLDLPQVNGYFSPGESKLKIIGARVSTWPQNNRFVPVSCQLLGLVLIHNRNKTSPSCDHTA